MLNLKVFISYVREDLDVAKRLYESLILIPKVSPWLDVMDLLPGSNWEEEINNAIENSRFVILVLSNSSINKYGYFQVEVREALKKLDLYPPGEIFLLPARVEDCIPRQKELKKLQWADLFDDWDAGIDKIKKIIELEQNRAWERSASNSSQEVASQKQEVMHNAEEKLQGRFLNKPHELNVIGPGNKGNLVFTDFGKELLDELIESDKLDNFIAKLRLNQLKYRRIGTSDDNIDLGYLENPSDYEFGAQKREEAALDLGRLGRPEAIEPLVSALSDEGDWGGCNETRTFFYKKDDGSRVRSSAVEALALIGKRGHRQAVDELKKAAVESNYFDVRIEARNNLIRHFNFDPITKPSLWDLENQIKKIYYDSPPLRGDDYVLPFLNKNLKSNDQEIREYCAKKIKEVKKRQ